MPFEAILMRGSAANGRAAVEVGLSSAHTMRTWMLEHSNKEHGLVQGQGARQEQRPQGELL